MISAERRHGRSSSPTGATKAIWPGVGAQVAHRGEFIVAVGALHPQRPRFVGENGQRFGGAEHGFERRAGRERRIGGDHHAGAVGEQRARQA